MKKIISILIVSTLLVCGCTPAKQKPGVSPQASSIFKKGEVKQIKVTENNTNCRSGEGKDAQVITKLKKDEIFNVVGQYGNSYVIKTKDNKVGVVDESTVKPHIEAPKDTNKSNDNAIASLTPNEQEMLDLLNGERTKNGLNPLKVDMEITKVARLKSQDMIDQNYFSHNSPTYGSPFDMLKKFGVQYIYAGENIAGNTSVKDAHTALMNSEGHRKNILNSSFTHIGIGIKEGGQYGKMFSQMFVGR
ncbi:SCP-like extracellular protein [Lutibacter sp. B2]|nr:SCP-like extracellular protein [Lutibacter sp. B2]